MYLKRRFKRFIRQAFPNAIDQFQRALGREDKTYADEFTNLRRILELVGSPTEFGFVDIGAGDGFNMSIAWPLMKQFHSHGLLIEPNKIQLEKARQIYKNNLKFSYSSEFLTPMNVSEVILESGFEKAFYIKIDIDSYDLEIMRSIILHGIKPKILSIEINELFPPPVKFEMRYSERQHQTAAPLYGCSIQSVYDFASHHGYILNSLSYNNAFFILEDFFDGLHGLDSQLPLEAYRKGFLDCEWKSLFPWDMNYEDWLTKPPSELVSIVKNLPDFEEEFFSVSLD